MLTVAQYKNWYISTVLLPKIVVPETPLKYATHETVFRILLYAMLISMYNCKQKKFANIVELMRTKVVAAAKLTDVESSCQ